MLKPTYYCDQCGEQKREANHWLAVRTVVEPTQILPRMETRAFMDRGDDDQHICGATCLVRHVNAFLSQIGPMVDQVEADAAEADRMLA